MVRYLVVCDRTLESHTLTRRMQSSCAQATSSFHFVVPASHPAGAWTWTEGNDRARAQSRLDRVLARLRARGLDVSGEVGDWSPVTAIADVLRPNPHAFDEILVCSPPAGLTRRVGGELAQRVERAFSLPVHHVVSAPTVPYQAQQLAEPGRYRIDGVHSQVGFMARFLTMGKVRGRFTAFAGELEIAQVPEESSVDITIGTASLVTDDRKRDAHLRSADFLDVDHFPTMAFRSTSVEPVTDESWRLHGELSIRDIARPVVLDAGFVGAVTDDTGGSQLRFAASTEIDRETWGLTWNQLLETGGVLIGRQVRVDLHIQATPAHQLP